MDIPVLKKAFDIEIVIKRSKFGFLPSEKTIYGSFEEASLQSIYSIKKKCGDDMVLWTIWTKDFLIEHTNIKKNEIKYIINKLDDILSFILNTYFGGAFKVKDDEIESRYEWTPFDVGIMSLVDNNPREYYRVINNLSISQIIQMIDCKIRNMNEGTKEGKNRNKKKMFEQPQVKAKYDKQFDKLDKILGRKSKDGK